MKVEDGPDIGSYFIRGIFSNEFDYDEGEEWIHEFMDRDLSRILENLAREKFPGSFPSLADKTNAWNLDRMYIVSAAHISDAGIENKTPVNLYFHVDDSGHVNTITMEHMG